MLNEVYVIGECGQKIVRLVESFVNEDTGIILFGMADCAGDIFEKWCVDGITKAAASEKLFCTGKRKRTGRKTRSVGALGQREQGRIPYSLPAVLLGGVARDRAYHYVGRTRRPDKAKRSLL